MDTLIKNDELDDSGYGEKLSKTSDKNDDDIVGADALLELASKACALKPLSVASSDDGGDSSWNLYRFSVQVIILQPVWNSLVVSIMKYVMINYKILADVSTKNRVYHRSQNRETDLTTKKITDIKINYFEEALFCTFLELFCRLKLYYA